MAKSRESGTFFVDTFGRMPINNSELLNSRPRIDSSFDLRGDDFTERSSDCPSGVLRPGDTRDRSPSPHDAKRAFPTAGMGFFSAGKRRAAPTLPQPRAQLTKFVTGLESRVGIRAWESLAPLGDHNCGAWVPQSPTHGRPAVRGALGRPGTSQCSPIPTRVPHSALRIHSLGAPQRCLPPSMRSALARRCLPASLREAAALKAAALRPQLGCWRLR